MTKHEYQLEEESEEFLEKCRDMVNIFALLHGNNAIEDVLGVTNEKYSMLLFPGNTPDIEFLSQMLALEKHVKDKIVKSNKIKLKDFGPYPGG